MSREREYDIVTKGFDHGYYNNCMVTCDVNLEGSLTIGVTSGNYFERDIGIPEEWVSKTSKVLGEYIGGNFDIASISASEEIYRSAWTYFFTDNNVNLKHDIVVSFKKLFANVCDMLLSDSDMVLNDSIAEDSGFWLNENAIGSINRYAIMSTASLYDAKALRDSSISYNKYNCNVFVLKIEMFFGEDGEVFLPFVCAFDGDKFFKDGSVDILYVTKTLDSCRPPKDIKLSNKTIDKLQGLLKFFYNIVKYLSNKYPSMPINKITIYPNTNANVCGFNLVYKINECGCTEHHGFVPDEFEGWDEENSLTDCINMVICMRE